MTPKHKVGLEHHGITNATEVFWNLATPALCEHIVQNGEGNLAHLGPVIVNTGEHTGRSPHDKFVVKEPGSQDHIWWDNNKPFDVERFDALYGRILAYLQNKPLYVQDCCAGADPDNQLHIRVITETAWHSLFTRNMFLQVRDLERLASPDEAQKEMASMGVKGYRDPEFTVIHAPGFLAVPSIDGTSSEVFVIVDYSKKIVLIGGTSYAGEIKKSVFSVLNYLLPKENSVLSMHCSANIGKDDDTAIFFGLSGTGKTTLSADPNRKLIGDDEHGWSDKGVFNFEGGCYAKVIRLCKEAEPEIYRCTQKFGTILENVVMDPNTRRLELDNASLTENTRASYPISHIENSIPDGMGGHPKNVIMLTCDAYGVMPPISKMTQAQAMYHFISGYTAKIAGTEKGLSREPIANFSTCFGAPFMTLHPSVYADLLGKLIAKHKVDCWLVNTGWTAGSFGVGHRISIAHTRAMIKAILEGHLNETPTQADPIFGLHIPEWVDNVPKDILAPRKTWKRAQDYDKKARKLAEEFVENFKKYEASVTREVLAASPKPTASHGKTRGKIQKLRG